MTTATARRWHQLRWHRPERIRVNGQPIRFRLGQMILWIVIAAACGSALVAGGYFNLLQVNWHIGALHLFYLKHWWDGTTPYHGGMGNLITSPNWTLYRHGIRDLGEPALATIAIRSLLAKRSTWDKRIGPVSLGIRLVLLIAVTIGLAVGGIWLINFGIPHIWAAPAWVVKTSLEQIALGFVIGQIVHKIWGPAGATIQGHFIDRAVERAEARNRTPLWVRFPIMPVQVRERFSVMEDEGTGMGAKPGRVLRFFLPVIAVLALYLIVTGFIAHYWVGTGHTFPYLAPH